MSTSTSTLLLIVAVLSALPFCAAWVSTPSTLFLQASSSRSTSSSTWVAGPTVPEASWGRQDQSIGTIDRSARAGWTALAMSSGEEKSKASEEKVVVGGGCFWCTEAVFLEAEGVERVVSGYAGGTKEQPSYREVVSGKTGHAECVEITFDPSTISLAQVLDLHMASHDPTQLNRQGVDVGTQYRSIILYNSEEQKAEALKAVERAQAEKSASKFLGLIPAPKEVVTQVLPLDTFWPAESYHQDYYAKNPYDRYSMVNITPKLRSDKVRAKLKEIKSG